MIVNDIDLLMAKPIKNMADSKQTYRGASHGLTEAGYDIRIKQEVRFRPHPLHMGMISNSVSDENKIVTNVGRFVLASAIEEFQMPTDLVGIVHDKSTWARHGLSVFNTVIEPGWAGFLTLELVYHGQEELIIPAGAGIAQVLFYNTTRFAEYKGKFANQPNRPIGPRASAGTHCSVCGLGQFHSPGGITCPNGHGGANSIE